MPVRRDPRTGRWYFRCTVRPPDGTKERLFGTPGVPGPYHDLAQSKIGALEAERRAISAALTGKPLAVAASATEEAPKTKTLNEHAETFMTHYRPEQKPSAKRDKQGSLNSLLPHFGDRTPEQLKQNDVDSFVAAELERGAARKSINNRLACLSTLLRYATGDRSKLRLHIGGMAAEIHAVDPAEVERLLATCEDDRLRAVVLLAAEAGLRVGEIRGLQWTDVRDGQITIRRALDKQTGEVITPKHDKARTVPMSPRVSDLLDAMPRRGLWVVSCDEGGAMGYWPLLEAVHALYHRAGVTRPSWPMHSLRHTFGTVMARRGTPLAVLQRLMGHADIQTTMRYVDVNEADKRDAIATVFGVAATWQQNEKP